MLVLTGAVLGTEMNRYDAIKEQQLTFIECTPRSESFMWIFTLSVYLHTSPFEATPVDTPLQKKHKRASFLPSNDPTSK